MAGKQPAFNTATTMGKRPEQEAQKIQFGEELVKGVATLFNNSSHADTKIVIRKLEIPAHGFILAIHSKYFEKALSVPLTESKTGEFHFTDTDNSPYAYWRALEYIYKGTYSEKTLEVFEAQDDDELMRDARVYALAEYFCMEGLKDYAFKKLGHLLRTLWVTENFIDCIREVYSTTPDPHDRLRALVTKIAREHISELWKKERFRDLIREGGDFAVDLTAQSVGVLQEY